MKQLSFFDQPRPVRLTLESIRLELGECTRCRLSRTRNNIVFGAGESQARVMFIGEGPGENEDAQGLPFVGRAGGTLGDFLRYMKLERSEVYITNVVKCRPPENRNPAEDEIEACSPFLVQQIESVMPKVIVALGTFPAQWLLKTKLQISRLRGKVYTYEEIPVVPTYHPAYVLRSPQARTDVHRDLDRVMELLCTS